ncbi:hypothetical protein HG531_005771 [Fusarium graminearum]|nr:hypothetical protein HG531_005771 [Fusarium graminearum]
MTSMKLTHNDYTVGWVCVLPKEQTAALAMLDCEHLALPKQPTDKNAYTLGAVGEHNVVIACLPKGMYGTNSAATVAARMLDTFPSIKFGLLVGIGAGIPPQVRLGDVVVSSPIKQYPGVVQWDFRESIKGGNFKRIGALNNPPSELLTALTKVESKREMTGPKIPQYLDDLATKYPKLKTKYIKSDLLKDPLFSPTGVRDDRVGWIALFITIWQTIAILFKFFLGWRTLASGSSADGESSEGPRDMQVHYGLIASGNRLIKDSVLRDNINHQMGGHVLCLEMEAAGLANDFPCLVIRGICDYADSGKNKDWQEHAAAVAAAFAKELLSEVLVTEVSQMRDAKIILEMKSRVDEISQNVTNIRSSLRDKQHLEILEWLTPIDYSSVHNDTIKTRQPGTCQWFLDSEKYQAWLEASKQTMLCQGIPGAGKTILTSVVVHDIIQRFHENSNVGIAYIYCNYRKQDDQTIDKISASLVKQLAERQAAFPKVIQDLHNLHKPRKTRPLAEELSETLRLLVETHDRVFILLDALDECLTSGGSRSELFKLLIWLKENPRVNLFMTSRYVSDVEEELQSDIIKMEIRASKEDVGNYLDSRLACLSDLVKKNKDLRDEIRTKVIEAVDGMFLLAELHARSLEGIFLPNQIRHALETLPTGTNAYDETYLCAMNRIESRGNTKDFAKKILAWITCARRPLTTPELRHALAVQVGDTDLDDSNLPEIGDVVAVCAGLVAVDKESDIIRLAHYTTQQYFERTKDEWFPNAETDITDACITYLSYTSFRGQLTYPGIIAEAIPPVRFYDYVAINWGHHSRKSQTMSKKLIEFLESDQPAKAAAQHLLCEVEDKTWPDEDIDVDETGEYESDHWPISHSSPVDSPGMEGLHLAAYFGIVAGVDALASKGKDVNVTGYLDRTPLAWAAKNGHIAAVSVLLSNGANANSTDEDCRTPLAWAAKNGHIDAVNVLLSNGANANSTNEGCRTPLSIAAENGHEIIVRRLLAIEGISADHRDISGRTPLSIVAENGHESIVSLLLSVAEVDADSRDNHGYSPLYYAAYNGHTVVFDRLISTNKIDINSESTLDKTPISAAVRSGHIEIVERLLRNSEFNINIKNQNGETLLFHAVRRDGESIVKLLLAVDDVEVDSMNKYGSTPLSHAVSFEFEGIAKLLIGSGKVNANINARFGNGGETLLMIAASHGTEGVVRALLKSGLVQVDARDVNGNTALIKAIRGNYEGVVELLLATGTAGVSMEDNEGYSPLTWAARKGYESIARLLLEVGHAGVDSKDSHGLTPLQTAIRTWKKPIVWLLLEHGAEFDEEIRANMRPLSESNKEEISVVMRAALGWM